MTSKLIDKLTKFCFHSPSPTIPASHIHNPSWPHPQPLSASPPTPLRMERGVITEIDLLLGIPKPISIAFTTKFCLYFTPSLYLSLCYSVFKKIICLHLSLCHSVFKNSPFFVCPSVILSQKIICLYPSLCHSVFKKIICLHFSLCHSVFKKIIYLHLSLCHSVSKNTSVFICHYVILSSRIPLSSSVPLLFCL